MADDVEILPRDRHSSLSLAMLALQVLLAGLAAYGAFDLTSALLVRMFSPTTVTVDIPLAAYDSMFWVEGIINGQKQKFIIDTGATDVNITRQVAQRLGIEPSGKTSVTSLADGREVIVDIAEAPSITVDGITVYNVTVSIARPGDREGFNVLGASFLSRIGFRYDPAARLLTLEQTAR